MTASATATNTATNTASAAASATATNTVTAPVTSAAARPRRRAALRYDWSADEVEALLAAPLLALLDRARAVHRRFHPQGDVQLASLISVKTGGCPENCAYCPQSAHYQAGVTASGLMEVDDVLHRARLAREAGASRFCMGAAWRSARGGAAFESILAMVRGVRALGMEACATLGMLTRQQARSLADAGLTAYNHNIDCSPEFYPSIITTRSFEERLQTLAYVRETGVQVCCGGIIGMGESRRDRARMLQILASFKPHPQSVPLNALVAVPGTPLGKRPPIEPLEMVRLCAAARIIMPQARVRLSAGRRAFSRSCQALCFFAGANSIFYGEKLLTTSNNDSDADLAMLAELGLASPPQRDISAAAATTS